MIPCSGIGKVHGLISREAVYHVTDNLLPGQADTVCLALLVTGDAETKAEGPADPLHHLGRLSEALRYKNVELSGGKIAKGIRVYDVMKRHRGANFGTATALSEEGWTVVEELAAEVAQAAKQPDAV